MTLTELTVGHHCVGKNSHLVLRTIVQYWARSTQQPRICLLTCGLHILDILRRGMHVHGQQRAVVDVQYEYVQITVRYFVKL